MTETSDHYDRRIPGDRSLRASDRDRDALAAILRTEHVAGRLTHDEFEERLEACLAARTYAELDSLIADLPHPEPPAVRADGTSRLGPRRWPAPFPLFPLVPIAIVAIVLSHGHLVWLAFPLVFFFFVRPLLWHRWWGPRRYDAVTGARASCYPGRR
jgi:hypothetical protein